MDGKQWAMVLHLSQLANYIVPLSGIVAPIVIWQLKKEEFPELDTHGKIVANWLISALIYSIVCLVLLFVLIGLPLLLILGALCIIFPIIGCVKASSGIPWKYPMSIKFLK